MAQNDSLIFPIKFVLESNGAENVIKQIEGKFQNIQLHLKGENIKIDGLEATFKKVRDLLGQVENKFKEVGSISLGSNMEQTFNNLTTAIQSVADAVAKLENRLMALSADVSANVGRVVAEQMKQIAKETEKATKSLAEFDKEASKSKKSSPKADVKEYDEIINRLRKYYNELKKLRAEALNSGVDKNAIKSTAEFQELENTIHKLKELMAVVREAKKEGASLSIIKSAAGPFATKDGAATEMERLVQAQRQAVASARELEQAESRMAQAMQNASQKASQQSQILSDLKSMAQQYLSVWGASSFVKEVAQITGELELQQKSLEVIIGSASKAQELFGSIKGMSQMSPYTFQDLLKSTRQLAAFGVQTKDLFGTMKSLSDLGAGLDVDVQRLILAYGHVKSSGVLTGIQRRQFETAGIGITEELAKLYNSRFREAGSGERYTASDIFKKITKREITSKDVEDVINRMTGPGGQFYNMQLRQFDTLGGKLRNLRNNYNIMMDEIGKSYMDLLRWGVDGLNKMMENWRTWKSIILDVVAALGAAKAASLALGTSYRVNRAAWAKQMATMSASASVRNVNASQGIGWAGAWWRGMWSRPGSSLMGMKYADEVNNNESLSKYQKIRLALYRNVSAEARNAILQEQGLGVAYQNNIGRMSTMRLAFERLRWSVRGFFNTMRAGLASIATNPMVWIGAAIAGITALVQRANTIKEQSEKIRKTLGENLISDIESLKNETQELRDLLDFHPNFVRGGTNPRSLSTINLDALRNENPKAVMETLDSALQKYDPLYKGHLLDINAMQNEADRVVKMFEILDDVAKAKEKVAKQANAIGSANESTGVDLSWENTFGLRDWITGKGKWNTFLEEAKEFETEYNNIMSRVMANERFLTEQWSKGLEAPVEEGADYTWAQKYRKQAEEIKTIAEDAGVGYGEAFRRFLTGDNLTDIFDETGKKVKVSFGVIFDDVEDSYGNVINNLSIDTNKLTDKIAGIKTKLGPIIQQLKSGLASYSKGDTEGQSAYIVEFLDKMFNVEGYEISGEAREALSSIMINAIDDSVTEGMTDSEATKWRENVLSKIFAGGATTDATTFIDSAIEKGLIDVKEPSEEQINALREKFLDGPIKKATAGRDDKNSSIIKSAYEKALDKAIDMLKGSNLKDWQMKIRDVLGLRFFDRDLQVRLGIKIDSNTDIQGVIEDCQKRYSEIVKIVTQTFGTTLVEKMNIRVDPAVDLGSLAGVQGLKNRIIQKALATGQGSYDAAKNLFSFQNTTTEIAQDVIALLNTAEDLFKIKNATGIDTIGPNKEAEKQRKAAEAAQRKKEAEDRKRAKAIKDAEDAEKKYHEERIRWMETLRRNYRELRKFRTPEEALKKAIDDYNEAYPNGGPLKASEMTRANIEDYTSLLEEEMKAIDASNKIKDKTVKDELKRRAVEARQRLESIALQEKSEEMSSRLNSQLKELAKNFETARKVFMASGDISSAAQIGNIDVHDVLAGFLDNLLEEHLNTRLAVIMQSLDKEVPEIDFDKVKTLDVKGIKEYAKELVGKEGSEQLSDAVAGWLEEYKKAYDEIGQKAVDAYTKAIASAMDYESQLQRINTELSEQNNLIDRTGASPEEKARAKEINNSRAEIRRLEISASYKRFFDGIFVEPLQQMEVMRKTLEGAYARALRSGAISAEEYAKKIEEINKVMREAKEQNPDAWWDKGFFNDKPQSKRAEEEWNKGSDIYKQGSDLFQQAMQKGDQKGAKNALEMMQKGQGMMQGAEKSLIALAIIDKVVHGIDKAIQGTVKAFNYLKDALEALGEENDTISTIGDYLGAIGEMSSHVTASWDSFKNGDMFGASVEAFGAITSLVTGFARAHDNSLQRKIDEIKENTTKMSNTLDSIKSLRERQLGYDNGDLRRMLQARYNITDYGDYYLNRGMNHSSAEAAMYDFYGRYSGGSGYEQELKLLQEQREKLMEMYDLEDKKKKSDKDALEEYKTQIAELDEQIRFFTEDLANSLWGIDLKGWADQFSDALMTAFENGTSAAAAFKDTVQDIMRGVVKNMLTVGIIEPALEKLRVKLFGQNGQGGLFDPDNPEGSVGAVLNGLANWFETDGPALMDAANEFYNGADNMLRQILGYGMAENEKSTNTVNSITSAASEETMGIVAGYLSRLSQDVSVKRIIQEMFVNGSWPSYIEQVTSANNSLSSIDRSTAAMMEMMRDGNGALYERVENMSRRLDNFANGIDRISVR